MKLPLSVWTTGAPVPLAEASHGSFFAMIARAVGQVWSGELHDVDCTLGQRLPAPHEVAGVIVTGSPARVASRDPWMLSVEAALRTYAASRTPLLGICFGHQLLGNALGGYAGENPRGREMGTPDIEYLEHDELVNPEEGPAPAPFVVMTHLDSVLQLPPGARVLARTQLEPHAAVRFSELTWGVQYHPEMNADVIACYIQDRSEAIRREGLDPDSLLASRRDSPAGSELLARFARLCASRRG